MNGVKEEDVEMLRGMFDHLDIATIKKALAEENGNVERAVDSLLNVAAIDGGLDSGEKDVERPPQEKRNGEHGVNGFEDQDALLAAALAQEDKLFTKDTHPDSDEAFAKMLEQKEHTENEDERLARQLQEEFNRSSSGWNHRPAGYYQQAGTYPSYGNSGLPQIPTNDDNGGLGGLADLEIGEEEIGEFVKALKSNMLPLLVEEFQSAELPSVDESVDAGKLGSIEFGLEGIKIAKAKIPEDKVEVNINTEAQELSIEIHDIKLKLKQFSWYYRKKKFPKLKDAGKMNAGISECVVKLKLGWSASGLNVTTCDVTVGALKIKVSGTIVSLVYNVIIAAVKKILKTQLEKFLADMIRSAVGDGAKDFLADM